MTEQSTTTLEQESATDPSLELTFDEWKTELLKLVEQNDTEGNPIADHPDLQDIYDEGQTFEQAVKELPCIPLEIAEPAGKPSLKEQRKAAERDAIERIALLMPSIRDATRELAERKDEAKSAKEVLESLQGELNRLGYELEQIKSGNWQPRLPFAADSDDESDDTSNQNDGESTNEDTGASQPISALGMTATETEALEAVEIETVGDLESKMRSDAWWYKKIKGFGAEKVDKVSDKLLEFRKEFPVPDED